jgi:ribosomal protein S28E/S33
MAKINKQTNKQHLSLNLGKDTKLLRMIRRNFSGPKVNNDIMPASQAIRELTGQAGLVC